MIDPVALYDELCNEYWTSSDMDRTIAEETAIRELARRIREEAIEERNGAAADILLALVTLKSYKDTIGKDEHYETEQPKAWKLAREFLQAAMPEEYGQIDEAIRALIDAAPAEPAQSAPTGELIHACYGLCNSDGAMYLEGHCVASDEKGES